MSRRPRLVIKPQYEHVRPVELRGAGKPRWSDNEIISLPAIQLTVLTNDQMNQECKIFLHGLASNMTTRSIASALILTWNLRAPEPTETRLFPDEDPGPDPNDVDAATYEIPGVNYTGEVTDTLFTQADPFEARRACTFLAASTLKLFSKTVSGWMLAWTSDHLKTRYRDFMKVEFPIPTLQPMEEQVKKMYDAYQGQRIFTGTLGRILYSVPDVENRRMIDMLFQQHLSCTGMHIVPQFIKAKNGLSASEGALLSALDVSQNTRTLAQLVDLINTSISQPLGPENRGTWRFARLFNDEAFMMLQTKNCADTVAILAYVNYQLEASSGVSNPLNIAVIKNMGTDRLTFARRTARQIVRHFCETSKADENEFYDHTGIESDDEADAAPH